ncbi:hypothetical protein BDQ12DRAFT_685596 [Crucibulum laeve]|uniref:Acyl-CoA oxidase C-alpha1 domain-containing protein n=1 Tax=Crucibulum laeve TaxID=68775 RepID=A0A5C3LYU0_9AGAR|nr:hypothetical protein BDQ12DRAFT_685596 [Crucibulum laeve]
MALQLPQPIKFASAELCGTHAFRLVGEETPIKERIDITHRRAKAVAMSHNLNIDDVLHCSQKYWNLHLDPMNGFDGAAVTFWTLQLNLSGGTLAAYVKDRPDLAALWDNVINFDVTAHYMLTELGHGLDAPNIETVAELLPSGDFDLHTPNKNAAKFMPASIPSGGMVRIAVVMARLKVKGKDFGVRSFIVPLNDGISMCKGITCRALPSRSGAKPLGHAITYFDHVKLPSAALLGDLPADRPSNPRINFLNEIWRIGIGSIILTAVLIPGLKVATYIAAEYSKRRKVSTPQGKLVPIISFRTQQSPILHALAQTIVLESLYQELRIYFTDRNPKDQDLRNGLATIFKVITLAHWRKSTITLADRCGAQGLFEHNQIISMEMEARGIAIAEGEVLVLSIRLASELLLGRYKLPASRYPTCALALHEKGIFRRMRTILSEITDTHRGEQFNRRLLPHSLTLAQAIGHRMAYEAALDAGVDGKVLRLYEIEVIMHDMAWYSENGLLTQDKAFKIEEEALSTLLPYLDTLLAHTGAKPYAACAPIISETSWDKFVERLPFYEGDAVVDAFAPVNALPFVQENARL